MRIARILITAVFLIFQFTAHSNASPQTVQTPHVSVRLLSESQYFKAGINWLGFEFTLDPEWHVYWKNPGDSGAAPRFSWKLPHGVSVQDIRWPPPSRLPISHLMNYGYEKSVVLLVPLEVSPAFTEDELPVTVSGEWLVCKEDCIPGEGTFEMQLKRGAGSSTPAFDNYRKLLPQISTQRLDYSASSEVLKIQLPEEYRRDTVAFLPAIKGLILNAAPQTLSTDGTLTIQRDKTSPLPREINGLLTGKPPLELTIQSSSVANTQKSSLLVYITLAFLGGILLNLMPCVLPVIGIKIFSLIEHAQSSAKLRRKYGAFFLAGVLASLWGIWGVVAAAQTVGKSFGWGFQLQEPWFVAFLIIILTLLSFNLLGFFEFGASLQRTFGTVKGKTPSLEAFFSGLLTTVVATPCTAPFMGTSIAYAFSSDLFSSFLIFTALGLGLGLPYLILCMSPGLLRCLPRPGHWMDRLKQLLAFPLLGTALWLIWVYGMLAGQDAIVRILIGILVVSFGVWVLREFGGLGSKVASRRISSLLFILFLSMGYFIALPSSVEVPHNTDVNDRFGLTWIPFSEEKVNELRSQGKTVYVDYTAAWCITCQLNKEVIFTSQAVLNAIRDKNIALVKADWTNPNPTIEASLKSFGKVGVPLNIVYRPGVEPLVLPSVLTPGGVLEALGQYPSDPQS